MSREDSLKTHSGLLGELGHAVLRHAESLTDDAEEAVELIMVCPVRSQDPELECDLAATEEEACTC